MKSRGFAILAIVFSLALVGASCGSDDLGDGIEGLPGNLADCAEISIRWGSLTTDALLDGSNENVEEDADKLKSLLPDEYDEHVDAIADAVSNAEGEGLTGIGEAMSTDEVEAANTAIADYLEETCASLGN